MGYVLTKEDPGGRIYALITPTRLIDYTLDIDTASVFQDKNEAEDLRKRATKKLKGFQTVELKKAQMIIKIARDGIFPSVNGQRYIRRRKDIVPSAANLFLIRNSRWIISFHSLRAAATIFRICSVPVGYATASSRTSCRRN